MKTNIKQDRKIMYNVILRRACKTVFALVKKQVLHFLPLGVCV